MNPKINVFFVIFLLLFSMFPIPIASAEIIDNNTYQGKNFIGTIPSVAGVEQGFKFQVEDDLITWSIDSITTRNEAFKNGGTNGEDTVGNVPLETLNSYYTNAFSEFNANIDIDFTENSMKQTIILNKSSLTGTYTYFTIDETIVTTKGADNYYINRTTNEKVIWTDKSTDKSNIQAKELYFGNNRLRLVEPYAYDEYGKSITGYYDVKASDANNFDVKTVFLESDIDTLSGTIYFDPTIENGFTGTTTITYTSQSGNQSFNVPNGSSYDFNITNNQEGIYSINGYDWEYKLPSYRDTTAAFNDTQ